MRAARGYGLRSIDWDAHGRHSTQDSSQPVNTASPIGLARMPAPMHQIRAPTRTLPLRQSRTNNAWIDSTRGLLMSWLLAATSAAAAAGALPVAPALNNLFVSGTLGVNTFRVPNIVTTTNGTLIAIAQGKLFSHVDNGATSILMRRSDTGGRSWTSPEVILSDPSNSSEFDAVLTYEPVRNTLILVYQAMKVRDLCQPCVQNIRRSNTYGRSWSAPTQLPSVNTTGGGGVSSGIVLTRGEHKGRLLVPQRHDCHGCSGTTNSFALISDDLGESFHGGALLPHGWSECQMAELQNGSVVITSRNDGDKTRASHRLFARSDDGAETWAATWTADDTLPDPRCEAALLGDPAMGMLYFGHPSSEHSRTNYSVHISRDGGLSWRLHAHVYSGNSEYSDMTFTSAGAHGQPLLACIFEKDVYKEIALAIIPKATSSNG